MADYDIGVIGLASPPTPAVVTTYRPAVSVRNNGIHDALARGTLRIYSAGLLVFSTEVYSGTIKPGETKPAQAIDYWKPPAAGSYMVTGYVTCDRDQYEPNNSLPPTTVTVTTAPPVPPPVVPYHASQHEEDGDDELNVDGLAGQLAERQSPTRHRSNHEVGGDDQLSVDGLAGQLAEPQVTAPHANEQHTKVFATTGDIAAHGAAPFAHLVATNLEQTAQKGQPGGYASLDTDPQLPRVPAAQLGGTPGPGVNLFLRSDRTWQPVEVVGPTPPETPALFQPDDEAIEQPTDGELSWFPAARATGYDVFLWVAGTPIRVSYNQPGTSYNYHNLELAQQYRWYILARNEAGTAQSETRRFNTILELVAPDPPVLLYPRNGATGEPLQGLLTWEASPRATGYDVWMWNLEEPAPIRVSFNQAGTSYHYSGLSEETLYEWYVIARNAAGESPESDRWQFRTIEPGPPPEPFALSSPPNAAPDQELSGTLEWESAAGATGYDVYLSRFDQIPELVSSNQPGTTYPYSGLGPSTWHNWRIVARNASGQTPSEQWTFRTGDPPGQPELRDPENGATRLPLAVELSWYPTPRATGYDVWYWRAGAPGVRRAENIPGLTWLAENLAHEERYLWWIVARNQYGSAASEVRAFSTLEVGPTPPTAFELLLPANHAEGQPKLGTLTWQPAARATGYDVFLWEEGQVKTVVSENQPETSFDYIATSYNKKHYWQVEAVNVAGRTESDVWDFETGPPPSPPLPPDLLLPPNMATEQPTFGQLRWAQAEGATGYDVYLGVYGVSVEEVSHNQPGLTYDYAELEPGTHYGWYVKSRNDGGTENSEFWQFWTAEVPPPLPDAPELVSPAANATGQPRAGTLSWLAAANAQAYDVWLYRFGSSPVRVAQNIVALSWAYSGLEVAEAYGWHVTAKNSTGTTNSLVRRFDVLDAPGKPEILEPLHEAEEVPLSGHLGWSAAPFATGYDVWLWEFGQTPILVSSNQPGRLYQYSGLEYATYYQWKIVARNVNGETSSDTVFFMTLYWSGPPPDFPVKVSPPDYSEKHPRSGKLVWLAANNAWWYEVWLYKQGDEFWPVCMQCADLEYAFANLAPKRLHWWQISGVNPLGKTPNVWPHGPPPTLGWHITTKA